MAGYSGTPLAKKLGIKSGLNLFLVGAPVGFVSSLGTLPAGAVWVEGGKEIDLIHFFSKDRVELTKALPKLMKKMAQDGMIWVSWPKKTSGVPSTVTEDIVREIALPLGLVDVKVCAVDEVWSGLKLVIRRENRAA